MKLLKGKPAIIGAIILWLIVIAIILYNGGSDSKDKPAELITVNKGLKPVDTADTDMTSNESNDIIITEGIDSKDFKYDPFAEDAGWGDESIFGSKIIVSGTGKRDASVDSEDGVKNSTKDRIRELTPAEARAAIMNEVKSSDYAYRINVNDFSDGFGIYMNPKYELVVSRIMNGTGYIGGPNGTEVGITELDNSISLNEHRKKVLVDGGYMEVYDYSKGAVFAYDTPVTFGVGINDFESMPYYTDWRCEDRSLNEYGGQLFCDTEIKSTFGSGYYIEMYNATSGLYYGYYLVEHNGRIFRATGMSTYRETLRDITLATVDTCVYPY